MPFDEHTKRDRFYVGVPEDNEPAQVWTYEAED